MSESNNYIRPGLDEYGSDLENEFEELDSDEPLEDDPNTIGATVGDAPQAEVPEVDSERSEAGGDH